MSKKKGKGVVMSGSVLPIGVGVYEDAKTQAKHQSLLQDYHELQRDAEVMKRKLEAARERKLTIANEVRFLRKRYKYLLAGKTTNVAYSSSPENLEKIIGEQLITRKEAYQHRLPPVPAPKPKKRRYAIKDVPKNLVIYQKNPTKKLQVAKETARHSSTPTSVLKHKERINVRRENYAYNYPVLDLNQMERMRVVNDSTSNKASFGFDLNKDSSIPPRKETSLQTRAPIFDLNEVSMGDEDFPSNAESVKNDEERQQNDATIASSICRNSGEGSSRMGKRKISWQDPVALKV